MVSRRMQKAVNGRSLKRSHEKGKTVKEIKTDETKLSQVKELIDQGANLMAEKDCETDMEARQELNDLQNRLREITGNKEIIISDFKRYWSWTDLETVAKIALAPTPQKSGLSEEEIREIVMKIANVEYDEATMDYFLNVLKVETGLSNITDYIYYPDEVGLDENAEIEEIIDKIIVDKQMKSMK